MELRHLFFSSIKIFLLLQLFLLLQESVSGQLDLPQLPGPPYPDPRGRNRWGVKYDPKKHGPSRDKHIGSSSHRNTYHGGPRRRPPPRGRRHNSFWRPGRRIRPHRRRRQRQSHFYGNDLNKKRPREYLQVYEEYEDQQEHQQDFPAKPEEQQFWNAWNAWYKKHEDHKAIKAVKSPVDCQDNNNNAEAPVSFVIDINNDDDRSKPNEDDGTDYGNYKDKNKKESGLGGRWKESRDYYMKRMKDLYSKAKGLIIEEGDDEGTEASGNSNQKAKSDGSWRVFTTIGKGLDAASGAMGSVKKVISGGVVAKTAKIGTKMAMNVITNVGTDALTKAFLAG